MRRLPAGVRLLPVCLSLALLLSGLPVATAVTAREAPLTLEQILSLLQQGTPPDALIARVEAERVAFDLTIEDVVRLRSAGAPPELVRMMARGGAAPELIEERPLVEAEEPPADALTTKKVVRMYHKGMTPPEIASQISQKGLKEPPDLQELLDLREQGIPEEILRALAGRGQAADTVAASAPSAVGPPLAPSEVIHMLELKQPAASIVSEINERGMQAAPSLDEALALRRAGATDQILAAINENAPEEPAVPTETPQEQEERPAVVALPVTTMTPAAPGEDRVLITSVPSGARVYVAPSRARLAEAFSHDYLAGRTPLSMSLPPGEYKIIVQKQAGAFEAGLVPAWRTLHDAPGTRTLLDNTDLTIDPSHCCLPGSLSDTVEVHSILADVRSGIIGDLFDGLAPYLFDGESLQILQVRKARITHAMKVYEIRKTAGQSRLLVSTFIQAAGDPLDQARIPGLPVGTPFDPYVDSDGLGFLTHREGVEALASTLGVSRADLEKAVAMLRRAGKATLHAQVDTGVRLVSIALDEDGRLRVSDRTIQVEDPFAPPPPVKAKKKKTTVRPPPPLPPLQREVVPGLGLPHLLIENKSATGLGLLFGDGQFCFVPPRTSHEFVIDPGTLDARVIAASQQGGAPQGTLHFSFHSRYSMTF